QSTVRREHVADTLVVLVILGPKGAQLSSRGRVPEVVDSGDRGGGQQFLAVVSEVQQRARVPQPQTAHAGHRSGRQWIGIRWGLGRPLGYQRRSRLLARRRLRGFLSRPS